MTTTMPQDPIEPDSSTLLAVLAPVLDWYQPDDQPQRPLLDIVRDVVSDLQSDRKDALAYKNRTEQYRELVRRLAVSKDKANAWYTSKAWCPFWRELAFDLPEEKEQQAMLFS